MAPLEKDLGVGVGGCSCRCLVWRSGQSVGSLPSGAQGLMPQHEHDRTALPPKVGQDRAVPSVDGLVGRVGPEGSGRFTAAHSSQAASAGTGPGASHPSLLSMELQVSSWQGVAKERR